MKFVTNFAKLLLLIHTVGSFGLLTWSLLHYVNRMDWSQVKYENDTTLDKSVEYWQSQIAEIQKLYASRQTTLAQAEADWEHRRMRIREREKEAENGKYYDIYFTSDKLPTLEDPRDDTSEAPSSKSFRLVFGKLSDDRLIKGLDKKPLKAVPELQKLHDTSLKTATEHLNASKTAREKKLELAEKTRVIFDQSRRLKVVLNQMDAEKDRISDNSIDFDEQLSTLLKRNAQLRERLGLKDNEPKQ